MGIPVLAMFLNVIPQNPKKMVFGLPSLPCGLNAWLIKKLIQGMADTNKVAYGQACKKIYGYDAWELFNLKDIYNEFCDPVFMTIFATSPIVGRFLWQAQPPLG